MEQQGKVEIRGSGQAWLQAADQPGLCGYFDKDSGKEDAAESASKTENTSIMSTEVALCETVMQ